MSDDFYGPLDGFSPVSELMGGNPPLLRSTISCSDFLQGPVRGGLASEKTSPSRTGWTNLSGVPSQII